MAVTIHMTAHEDGLEEDKQEKKPSVSVANGAVAKSQKVGSLKGTFCDKHGVPYLEGKMEGAAHIKGPYNLYSITKALSNGWKLTGNQDMMKLTKGEAEIKFDLKIKTPRGTVFAAYFKRSAGKEIGNARMDTGREIKMSIKEAHAKFSHQDEDQTRAVAKALGITIT